MSDVVKRAVPGLFRRLARRGLLPPGALRLRINALETELNRERHRADQLQQRFDAVRVHPILFTSMPKSGTYFVTSMLGKGLAIQPRIVANQYFPYDSIRFFEIQALARDGGISQDHFDASPLNLTHIGRFFDRVTVMVRDPRQAMLSWIHFIDGFRDNPETYLFIYPPLPEAYFDRPLADRVDWAIEHWLPLLVEWTEGWLRVADRGGPLKVHIGRYEDMVADQDAFFAAMLDFHAVPRGRFVKPHIPLGDAVHFRRGETDEWRRVMSPAQQAAAEARIPESVAARLGWARSP
ncbi:MAG: hypothetical protein R3F55_07555 [Alphaproteobacteria bacterium]